MSVRNTQLLIAWGAIEAARAALRVAIKPQTPESYATRIDNLDEELRKIARDIAKECGI